MKRINLDSDLLTAINTFLWGLTMYAIYHLARGFDLNYASAETTKSAPPPPGCIIKDPWVDDDHDADHHHDGQIHKG